MSGSVTMYTTPWCGYCHRLKGQLDREGIALRRRRHRAAARGRGRSSSASTTATRPCRRWSSPTAPRRRTRRVAQVKEKLAALASADASRARRAPVAHQRAGQRPAVPVLDQRPARSRRRRAAPACPASASACISARVNHRASSISRPSTVDLVDDGAAEEAQHQAGRQRPRLVAEVGHLADHDAGLLGDLAAYGVLERLARLEEAGQRGVAARRPAVLPSEQQRLVVDPGSPWVIAMITAGSVRGNWRRWHSTHASSCPASRGSSRPPQRGQCRVANSHSASPIAWNTSGACSTASPARCGSSPRSPTQLVAVGARPGRATSANHTRPSRSPSSTRMPSPGASAGDTQCSALVDRARPGCRRRRAPATAGSAQAASSQASSARRSPTRSWGSAASATWGYLTPGRLVPRRARPGQQPTAYGVGGRHRGERAGTRPSPRPAARPRWPPAWRSPRVAHRDPLRRGPPRRGVRRTTRDRGPPGPARPAGSRRSHRPGRRTRSRPRRPRPGARAPRGLAGSSTAVRRTQST